MNESGTTADELARARALVAAEHAKEQAAAAERPKAICAMCGGVVRAGRELVAGEPTIEDRRVDAERTRHGLPALHGWQRRHEACISSAAIVRAITGRKVSDAVASAALGAANPLVSGGDPFAVPIYADLRSTHVDNLTGWKGKAWAHLTDDDRKRLSELVDEKAREQRLRDAPHGCLDGACGFCGVALSRAWHIVPLKWSDGTPAPACAACSAVVTRRPQTTDMRKLRAIGIEALSGASGAGLADYLGDDMRLFCEVAQDDHSGTAEPWTFAPEALADVREAARMALPGSLPEPLRTEYREKVAAARQALREQRERADADERRAELEGAGWTR